MRKKLTSLLPLVFVACATAAAMRLFAPTPQISASPVAPAEPRERRRAALLHHDLVHGGARLGVAALASAPAAEPMEEEGTPEADERERRQAAEQAASERRHFETLEELARTGSGTEPAARVRENIIAGRKSASQFPAGLDRASVTCGEALCRVQVPLEDRRQAIHAAAIIGNGMANFRVRHDEKDLVFYVGAPGRKLPPRP